MQNIVNLSCKQVVPGDNDRTVFNREELEELAASIQAHGLAQPITVRPLNGKYQIVAGERRFRAISQVLRLPEVPAIVRELSDEEAAAIMLAENVSRKDIDPVDEAKSYQKRMDQFGWSIAEVARRAGASEARVRGRLKLTKVREDILHLVRSGNFPIGHAEKLSALDHNRQMIAARPIIEGKPITARDFDKIVGKLEADQSQESLFDTSVFFVQTVTVQEVVVEEAEFPVREGLPEMDVKGGVYSSGQALVDYSRKLYEMGMCAEAGLVGWVLRQLAESNLAQIPFESSLGEPEPDHAK